MLRIRKAILLLVIMIAAYALYSIALTTSSQPNHPNITINLP